MTSDHRMGSKGKEALDEYASLVPTGDTAIEDAERMIVHRERWDDVVKAMNILSHAVNCGDPKEVSKAMFVGICEDHRTLQAQVVDAMLKFLSIYSEASYDLRNRAAVEAAEKVTGFVKENAIYIPLI
jgi:hypothetical protein